VPTVPLVLEAIKLNHNPAGATTDALNMRRNKTTFVTVPEWRRGVSVLPADSVAAYSIADTTGHTLTIQAQFSCTEPGKRTFEVRAVDPTVDPPAPEGCSRGCLPLWRLLASIVRALVGNVLGDVTPKQVTCSHGQTGWETFELANTRVDQVGVGIHETTWRWQYRQHPSDPWTDFETSRHRIYVLLDLPKAPWVQSPYDPSNTQLPWVEVMDYACQWAVLKTDKDEAAAAVTARINGLGPSLIEYDCPGGGGTHYGGNCTAFLDRLKGGTGNGKYVNCSDCATFVSTFANILGCDLWQSQMGWDFDLNPILAIGESVWYPGCPDWLLPSFTYHEVAWKGACLETDRIFDACLHVDGDADPTTAPHSPLLPTNMLFGAPGSGAYRDRLATPSSWTACAPQPTTKTHRMIT
jgi:hypothetical protein